MSGVELFTIGSTVVTLADAAAAAGAVGSVVGAAGAISQGQATANMARYNAQVAENEAVAARQQAAYEEERQRERAARLKSSTRAAIAKSGLDLEGSPLAVMEDTAVGAELDALAIRYSGSVAEARARSQAAMDRMQGQAAKTASYFSAGASLLNGASALGRIYGAAATPTKAASVGDYPRSASGQLEYDP